MHWFHSNFAELCITETYRSNSILVITHQIMAMTRFRLIFCCSFLFKFFLKECIDFIQLCRTFLLYVFPCVILCLYFSVLLVLRLPCLGKRELILRLFVRLFGLCLFRFVGFLFLLGSEKGCGLWLWHSRDFSLTFFYITVKYRSSSILVIICQILAKHWPFFDLVFVGV